MDIAGHLKRDVSPLFAKPAMSNALAGGEAALLDMKSGVTEVAGHVLHKDVSGSLAADDKQRARIAAGADTHSLAFKAGNLATHVVVDTAATVALAAGGEFVLGAAGVGAAATGAAASLGLGEAAAGVAGRLALGAAANAAGSGAVTALEGGHARDVLKAAAVGGLSVGVGHAVGEAVNPLARAVAGRVARAAPKLAGASGKVVRVGAEAVTGAATGGVVSAATGDNRHDVLQNALFGGALSSMSAVVHTRGAHGPASQGQPRSTPGHPRPHEKVPPLAKMASALQPVGDKIRLGRTKIKHAWNGAQDAMRPAATFVGTTPSINNPLTHGSLGSQFAVFPRAKPDGSRPKPTAFFTSPQYKVAVPHGVPIVGGATFTSGGTYSYVTSQKTDAAGASFTFTKPIATIPGTGIGVSGGIWGSVGQSGTLTFGKVRQALTKPEGIPEEPFKMTVNFGLIGSVGWPGFKVTGGTMHTLHIVASTEGKLDKVTLNNTNLPLHKALQKLSIGLPHRVIVGGLNRLGAAKRRRLPALNAAGAAEERPQPAQDAARASDGAVPNGPVQGRGAGDKPTPPSPPHEGRPSDPP